MKFLDVYWIIYFIAYVAAVAILLWLEWDGLLREDDPVLRLAAIYGVAAGSASVFAILVEGGGRTVLLIPKAVNKLLDQGRAEGRVEGRAEGRAEGREERDRRYDEAYRRFGVEVDGVIVLPRTPEVQEFLDGKPEERGK